MTPYLVIATILAFGPQAPGQKAVAREQARERARQEAQAKTQQTIALQVALHRAGFSTGVVDGKDGKNTTQALESYRKQNGGDPQPPNPPLIAYQITEQDAAGPFERVPADLMEQSKLSALSYQSVLELVAERFHTTPQFLQTVNPEAKMTAGENLLVPNVEPFALPTKEMSVLTSQKDAKPTGTSGRKGAGQPDAAPPPPARPPVAITVSRSAGALTVSGENGKVLFFGPVTTGSERDPLPIGEWKVTGIHFNPPFRYNPDLFWDADPAHTKATIPPGPNGPVGVVWIDLSKEHYGIHGTPEPSTVGKTQSHGCVRLTNWDATRVAMLVSPGTPVRFVE